MISIPVANSDLLDRYSILRIKIDKGLQVEKELELLTELAVPLFNTHPSIIHLFTILKAINNELWSIEDTKRAYEKRNEFDTGFVEYARLVYLLNDERARVKKMIDTLSESELSEVKSHF